MMKVEFTSSDKYEGAVVVPVFADNRHSVGADALDEASDGTISRSQKGSRFTGKSGQVLVINAPSGVKAQAVVLGGMGDRDAADVLGWEAYGARAMQAVLCSGAKTLVFDQRDLDAPASARAAFGALLAAYRFDKYRTTLKDDKKPSITAIRVICSDSAAAKAAFAPLSETAEGVCLARDLVSEPANVLHPEAFAKRAQELEEFGLEVQILDEKDMKKLGMNALLSVGQGSNYGSKLAVMSWFGAEDRKEAPLVLVGKGVCFDTGGISLKPGAGMWDMKGDMGGAAAVTGIMRALAGRKARANVIGIIGLVENMPDAAATRPGDIITSADGQTIEVQNTDAEGRLVLVDALWYGLRYKPKQIIDFATLTGAIIIALGHENAGLFSNDDALASALDAAGKASGEPVWRLPLGAGYDKLIDSKYADMKNIGGRGAGSITAAQFLRRYVGETPWAHIDIAGTAWKDKSDDPREPVWATGYGVRLIDAFVAEQCES
ncbi:MAG: leucyl aminopeptidase [Robiginitomaculum sp.]|nr:leucyl aminopeptidase [Robiginitomaculum sp.]MDQ7077513.1 leucyl aminopeptidase [Robiginitomaculum sp.]